MTTCDSQTMDRALGALSGLSLGDALGMPTQSMSDQDINTTYGRISTLRDAVHEQPIAPDMPAGSVTDDTDQALIVADLLIQGEGHIDPQTFAQSLLRWEDSMRARGSHDLLGPSTKLALEEVRAGADIASTGKTGCTNGAAMRVTPVGIATPIKGDTDRFARHVYESCQVTHDTLPGFQGAALVAAAVSYGIDGADTHQALQSALTAVSGMQVPAAWSPKANVLTRARISIDLAQASASISNDEFEDRLRAECGSSVEANESVPTAFALAWRFAAKPKEALLSAANLGGDTDTIAAMTGAMLGACNGVGGFPEDLLDQVASVSKLDLVPIARQLMNLRSRQDGRAE